MKPRETPAKITSRMERCFTLWGFSLFFLSTWVQLSFPAQGWLWMTWDCIWLFPSRGEPGVAPMPTRAPLGWMEKRNCWDLLLKGHSGAGQGSQAVPLPCGGCEGISGEWRRAQGWEHSDPMTGTVGCWQHPASSTQPSCLHHSSPTQAAQSQLGSRGAV